MLNGPPGPRACTVVGSPIAHSLSPLLHRAAYDQLGLTDWAYTRREVRAGELAAFCAGLAADGLEGLPPGGISVTMPAKQEALALADAASARARAVRAANTLLPIYDDSVLTGWRAENTDVAGIVGALAEVGLRDAAGLDPAGLGSAGLDCVIVGAGGTAGAAVVALAGLGVISAQVVARDAKRAEPVREVGADVGVEVGFVPWGGLADAARRARVLICTVPPGVADELSGVPLDPGAVVLDAVYADRGTALLRHAKRCGARAVDGVWMLLHQAVEQVELMTGRRPAVQPMRAALEGQRRG